MCFMMLYILTLMNNSSQQQVVCKFDHSIFFLMFFFFFFVCGFIFLYFKQKILTTSYRIYKSIALYLTFTTLWANSADDTLIIFFF